MGNTRPGFRQKTVLHLEPKRAAATLVYGFVAVAAIAIAVGALIYPTETWPFAWRPFLVTGKAELEPASSSNAPEVTTGGLYIAAGVAAAIALVFLVSAIVNGRRWRTARTVERLSEDPELAGIQPDSAALAPPPHRAAVIPPLLVDFRTPRQFDRPDAKFRRVRTDANIVGQPPLRIAYLRLFENQPRMRTFIEGAWREFGYVYFLRSAAAVTPAELRIAKRSGNVADLFVASPARLAAELDGRVDRPLPKGRHKFTRIGATTIRVRDRYGSYPLRPVLCHGSYWKAAVDVLLTRVELVVLDLSGYTQRNAGTRYELQQVIDRVAMERVVFLADRLSNEKFLHKELQIAWSQMAPGSPNSGPDGRTAVVAVTDIFRRTETRNEHGQVTQVQTRLVARRRETRRVAAAAQRRLMIATNGWERPRSRTDAMPSGS